MKSGCKNLYGNNKRYGATHAEIARDHANRAEDGIHRKEYYDKRNERRADNRENMERIIAFFNMLYSSRFSLSELNKIREVFKLPREPRGVVLELGRQLQLRNVSKEKWLQMAAKVFGVQV